MKNSQIVIDALTDKIAALEQEKLDLVRESDARLDESAERNDRAIQYLIEITTDDFARFIEFSKTQIAQASKTTLRSTVAGIASVTDCVMWGTAKEIQALFDFYEDLQITLENIDAENNAK